MTIIAACIRPYNHPETNKILYKKNRLYWSEKQSDNSYRVFRKDSDEEFFMDEKIYRYHFSEDQNLIKVLHMGIRDIQHELTLNKKWIYDKQDEIIGEDNFVVSQEWFDNFYESHKNKFPTTNDTDDINDFLSVYEPETDGEYIYQHAETEKKIINTFIDIYDDTNGE